MGLTKFKFALILDDLCVTPMDITAWHETSCMFSVLRPPEVIIIKLSGNESGVP
jgi:hypothetical protein